MKTNILILILSFVPLIMQAQTDSLYRKGFAEKVNDFRKGKSMNPLNLSQGLNHSAETVLKKGYAFKDAKGRYNKDSVRTILRENGIFDYQFGILEKVKTKNTGFVMGDKLSPELQNALNDSLHNTIGVTSVAGKELVILTKHYVDLNPEKTGSIYLMDGSNQAVEIIEIIGTTKLNNLKVHRYEMSKDIETSEPIDTLKFIKNDKNEFKIKIETTIDDISKSRQDVPKKISIIDSLGNIIAVMPI